MGSKTSRSYGAVLDDSVEEACVRLISAAAGKSDDEPESDAEAVQRRLIDEFGACLAQIIANAEKRKLACSS